MLAAIAIAALGVFVYRGALAYFFSQDDFAGLARATGHLPRLLGPWRLLSHQIFWDMMWPLAGFRANVYHGVSLASHALCGVLLYDVLRRFCGRPAAFAGAAFFVCHPASFTALYWISALGDVQALLFGLVALRLTASTGAWRWGAVAAFVLSLASKESTLLLPAVAGAMLIARRPPGRTPAGALADPVHFLLWGVSGVWAWFLVFGHASGTPAESSATAAYAVSAGANLWQNLLTYLGWCTNFILPLVRGAADQVDPASYGFGLGLIAAWLLGLASQRLRDRGWVIAAVAVLAFLLPVLPLTNHTYHYYAYAALFGVAWMVAGALSAWLGTRERLAWGAALVVAALVGLNGAAFVRVDETAPFVYPESRADATVDRALIAARAAFSVSKAALPPGSRLAWVSAARADSAAAPPAAPLYWERNVRTALLSGLAIELLFPALESVRFLPDSAAVDRDEYAAIYQPSGRARITAPSSPR